VCYGVIEMTIGASINGKLIHDPGAVAEVGQEPAPVGGT